MCSRDHLMMKDFIKIPNEKYIPPEKIQQIIDELRLI